MAAMIRWFIVLCYFAIILTISNMTLLHLSSQADDNDGYASSFGTAFMALLYNANNRAKNLN